MCRNVKHALQFLIGHFKQPGSTSDVSKKHLQSRTFEKETIKAVGRKMHRFLGKIQDTYCTNTKKTFIKNILSRHLP